MYEVYEQLLQKHGTTNYKVAKETGIAQSVLSAWKNGISTPKQDKLQKIADYFNVSVDFLMTGKESDATGYYLDPRTAEIAQEIANNKELGGLFDTARTAKPEDLETVQTMLEALKRKETGE